MQHAIQVDVLGPQGPAMAGAIESCVHCGFCLPTCPTYVTGGEEPHSPRGRIFLMKDVLEGRIGLDEALAPIDSCLGCQACVTACPSGVEYGELISAFRAHHEPRRPLAARVQRALIARTLPYPRRFRAAARLGARTRRFAPKPLRPMLDLLPDRLPKARPLPATYPAEGERRARVALLAGCAQQVLDPDIGWATLRVLARNGVETVVPSAQGCCGALAQHAGAADQARRLARRNLAAFPEDVDAVIVNAAGCGSGMREYGLLFAGAPDEDRARALAARATDVSAFLDELGLVPPAPPEPVLRVAYHDACHLAHAQKVREAPQRLLRATGHEVVVPDEWELCCGSAGTYNVEQPETAAELGRRKADNLRATGADVVAAGNIGCLTQIRQHLKLPVVHTVQILDRAYAGVEVISNTGGEG
jgi:glycolate oxidase iron-sulfur subunit